jgi:hypothetical protein
MALSGSINYDLTAREVITFALRKINILAKSQTLTTDLSDDALVELNTMLKEWMAYPAIWRLKEGYVNLVAATESYSLTPRPYRIVDVRYRNSSSTDLPMEEMTKDEYYDLPVKTTAGTPTQWHFDPQQATSTLYVWPVKATVTTETFRVTYQRYIDDIDSLDNNIDCTPEWLSTLGYNLAARCADSYGRSGPHIDRIVAMAGGMFERMADFDRPEFVRFMADRRYG